MEHLTAWPYCPDVSRAGDERNRERMQAKPHWNHPFQNFGNMLERLMLQACLSLAESQPDADQDKDS
jgi:hypothetical protein